MTRCVILSGRLQYGENDKCTIAKLGVFSPLPVLLLLLLRLPTAPVAVRFYDGVA